MNYIFPSDLKLLLDKQCTNMINDVKNNKANYIKITFNLGKTDIDLVSFVLGIMYNELKLTIDRKLNVIDDFDEDAKDMLGNYWRYKHQSLTTLLKTHYGC